MYEYYDEAPVKRDAGRKLRGLILKALEPVARSVDAKLAERMAMFARHGGLKKGDHQIEGINSRLDGLQAAILSVKLKKLPEWENEKKHIERTFEFDEFSQAIDFVNSIAEIAEDEDHHPDMDIRYNKVRVQLSTHAEGGLTERDFEVAKKIDNLIEG